MKILTTASDRKKSRLKSFHGRRTASARFLASLAIAGMAATGAAPAAPATWTGSGLDSNWGTPGNWNPGVPGAVGTTNNTDTATFAGVVANTIATLEQSYNLQNVTFSGATASAYTINASGGSALLLTSGGTISSTAANVETVNAPLVIEPASTTTAGTYTFSSNATLAANVLNMTGAVTLGTTTAADTLNLAGTNTGANTFSGTISDTGTGGLILNKSGAGSWTFGGNGTSTLAKGAITDAAGTLNFGNAANTPTLAINGNTGSSVGVFLTGGSFNMNAGSLAVTAQQGLVIAGAQTYTQTGGTFSTSGYLEFSNNGGGSIVNISGGNLTATGTTHNELALRGFTTMTLSGTGVFTAPNLDMTSTQTTGGSSVLNLGTGTANAGTLAVGQIFAGSGTNGTTFNFNGGVLQSSASSTTFLTGLTNAFVKSGGAIVNTGAFNDTIGQNLLTDAVSTGGGLTKQGTGTLTLTGANTYTGANQIAGGTLAINSDGSLGAVPGSAASDIQFTGTGTLQDATSNVTLNANRNISIANGATATLDSSANTFQVGGATGIVGAGATVTTLALIGTTPGAGDLMGTVSDTGSTGGLVIAKSGTGTWTFGGNGTSTLAKGEVTANGGALNFGSATEAPTLTISGPAVGNLGVSVGNAGGAGTFNMNAGSLTVNAGQGLVLYGNNTYNQTGGAFSTNGLIEFANNGTTNSTVNISGGSLTTTFNNPNDAVDLAVRGTTIVNLSGTGMFTTPVLNMSTSQVGSGAASSTFNLNGGTLVTGTIIKGTGGSTGTQIFNFNGGMLRASASSTTFLNGLTAANVQAGGAVIDTNGKNDTIGQNLLTDAVSTGGGLTKQGTGTLTLTGANTYTGATQVNGGTLAVNGSTAAASTVTVASAGTLTGTGIVGGSVTDNGTLNSGGVGTVGSLTTGADTFNPASSFVFDYGNNSVDELISTGLVSGLSSAAFSFTQLTGSTGLVNPSYTLVSAAGGFSDTTLPTSVTGTPGGYQLQFSGNNLNLVQIAAAPEPSSGAAFGLGLLVLGTLRLKARRRVA